MSTNENEGTFSNVYLEDGKNEILQKERHSCKDGPKCFPNHYWVYIIHNVMIFLLIAMGIFVIICGNYANTGYFAIFAITNNPWPAVKIDAFDETTAAVEMLQLTCWISGFFVLFFSVVLMYMVIINHRLMFSKQPYNRSTWNKIQKDADRCLVEAGVRDEEVEEQANRLTLKQLVDINNSRKLNK